VILSREKAHHQEETVTGSDCFVCIYMVGVDDPITGAGFTQYIFCSMVDGFGHSFRFVFF
jgi:hypothetical protein